MNCPACESTPLAMTERQGIEIDYCPRCRGVWLDRGELDKLLDRAAGRVPAERLGPAERKARGLTTTLQPTPEHQPPPARRLYDHPDDRRRRRRRRRELLDDLFDFDFD